MQKRGEMILSFFGIRGKRFWKGEGGKIRSLKRHQERDEMIVGPLIFLIWWSEERKTLKTLSWPFTSLFFPFFLSFFFLRNGHEFAECLKSCASILLTKWAATSYVGPYEALQHCGPDVCKAESEDESPTWRFGSHHIYWFIYIIKWKYGWPELKSLKNHIFIMYVKENKGLAKIQVLFRRRLFYIYFILKL